MQSQTAKVLIFPIITNTSNSARTVLLSANDAIRSIQDYVQDSDASCMYSATRIFLKNAFGIDFGATSDTISEKTPSLWTDETFRQWLGKFNDADFYDDLEAKRYSFLLHLTDQDIKSIKDDSVVRVSEDEF